MQKKIVFKSYFTESIKYPKFPYFTNDFQNSKKCGKNAPPRR